MLLMIFVIMHMILHQIVADLLLNNIMLLFRNLLISKNHILSPKVTIVGIYSKQYNIVFKTFLKEGCILQEKVSYY